MGDILQKVLAHVWF